MKFKFRSALHERTSDERGSVAGEYAVLMALIAISLLTVIGLLRESIINTLEAVIGVLP